MNTDPTNEIARNVVGFAAIIPCEVRHSTHVLVAATRRVCDEARSIRAPAYRDYRKQ